MVAWRRLQNMLWSLLASQMARNIHMLIAHVLIHHVVASSRVVIEAAVIFFMKPLFLFLNARLSLRRRCLTIETVGFYLSEVQERWFVADLSMPVDIAVPVADAAVRVLHVGGRRVE